MIRNLLRTYGSTALGSTALLASQSDAATVVDVNASFYDTGLSAIGTVERTGTGDPENWSFVTIPTYVPKQTGTFFRRGTDESTVAFSTSTSRNFDYAFSNSSENPFSPKNGAELNSSDNWFYASSPDGTQRVWLQFQFGGGADSSNFSIIKAVYPDAVGELPSAQSAAAVPEPSAIALLSLGVSGLLIRRRKQAA